MFFFFSVIILFYYFYFLYFYFHLSHGVFVFHIVIHCSSFNHCEKKNEKSNPHRKWNYSIYSAMFLRFCMKRKKCCNFFLQHVLWILYSIQFEIFNYLFVCLTNKPNYQLRCLFETFTNYMIKYFKCNCHLKTYLTKCCHTNVLISVFKKTFCFVSFKEHIFSFYNIDSNFF